MNNDYFNWVFNTKYIEEDKEEHRELISYVEKQEPLNIIVEIGVKFGGSLLLWQKLVSENGLVIGIDIDKDSCLQGFQKNEIQYENYSLFKDSYPNFVYQLNNTNIFTIFSDSTGYISKMLLQKILVNKQIDFLFIDGYHNSPGPLKDFNNFIDLVRPNGLICCADIGDRDLNLGGEDGTRELWNNLPEGKKITKMKNHHQGMGLWWKL